ncbi:MAG: signal peptidase II [Pseudohongiellaceae bacterium]
MTQKTINMAIFAAIAAAVLTGSQAIGYWINETIELNTTVEISSFVHFTHIRNFGGVFGMFQGSGWVFAVISISLLIAVTAYLAFSNSIQRYEYLCFGFIVGGGASNILDRLIYGSVIDFIDIQHIPYWNYVFNTADVMVHVGIWPMLFMSLFGQQNQNEKHTL